MPYKNESADTMNVLVNFVSRPAVFYRRMLSGMGRNVQFYCERFGTSLYGAVILVKERKHLADEEMIWRAYMIKELVMVRDGVCCLSSDEFFRDDVLALIFNLSDIADFFKNFFVYRLLALLCVYFEYDLQ